MSTPDHLMADSRGSARWGFATQDMTALTPAAHLAVLSTHLAVTGDDARQDAARPDDTWLPLTDWDNVRPDDLVRNEICRDGVTIVRSGAYAKTRRPNNAVVNGGGAFIGHTKVGIWHYQPTDVDIAYLPEEPGTVLREVEAFGGRDRTSVAVLAREGGWYGPWKGGAGVRGRDITAYSLDGHRFTWTGDFKDGQPRFRKGAL